MRQKTDVTMDAMLSVIDTSLSRTECLRQFLMAGLGGAGLFNKLVKEYGLTFASAKTVSESANSIRASKWIRSLMPAEWYLPVERIREIALIRAGVYPAPVTVKAVQAQKHITPMTTAEWTAMALKGLEASRGEDLSSNA